MDNCESGLYNLLDAAYTNAAEKDKIAEKIRPYLNKHTNLRFIPKGGKIFSTLDPIKHVYLLVYGEYCSVRYSSKGQYNMLARRKGLQFLGLIEVINKFSFYEATTEVISDSIVIEIEKNYFMQQILSDTRIAMIVINNLGLKLMDSVHNTDKHLFYDSTYKFSIYVYRAWTNAEVHGERLKIEESKEFIAQEIGVSLRSIYRSIKDLKEKNLISVHKGKIFVTKQQFEGIKNHLSELISSMNHV